MVAGWNSTVRLTSAISRLIKFLMLSTIFLTGFQPGFQIIYNQLPKLNCGPSCKRTPVHQMNLVTSMHLKSEVYANVIFASVHQFDLCAQIPKLLEKYI